MYQSLFYGIKVNGEQDRQVYLVSVYLIRIYPSEITQCDTSPGVPWDLWLAPTEFSSAHSGLHSWSLAVQRVSAAGGPVTSCPILLSSFPSTFAPNPRTHRITPNKAQHIVLSFTGGKKIVFNVSHFFSPTKYIHLVLLKFPYGPVYTI